MSLNNYGNRWLIDWLKGDYDMEIDNIAYCCGVINSYYRRIYRKVFHRAVPFRTLNGQTVIHDPKETNRLISQMIDSNKPFMISRFGSTELSAINNYYKINRNSMHSFSEKVKRTLCNNSGFFPNDEKLMGAFVELILQRSREADIFGLWNDKLELFTISQFATKARGIDLFCLEPYYDLESSWTHALEGKKILVVHPFEETIMKQFLNRKHLFDKEFWPDNCELTIVKAVQTIAGQKDERFETWFDALEYMEKEIVKKDFDIAIIGCGAYGLPLASYVKKLGKQAIHLGGATQLLFGIGAKRWDNTEISRFYNEFWTRPASNEKPRNATIVENGCYW